MSYQPGIPSGLHRSVMRDSWNQSVDTYFGETLTIQPMSRSRVNSLPSPDQTRKSFKVAGVFRAAREPHALTPSDATKLNIAMDKPCFSIALAALPSAIRIGDAIIRQSTGEWYEVRAMKSDSMKVRGYFEAVALGVQPPLGGDPNL